MDRVNAFEQLICEETQAPNDTGHRVFVRRYAHPEAFRADPLDPGTRDLRPLFRLTSRWQVPDDAESVELDEIHYAFPPRTRRERMEFHFTLPTTTPEGGVFHAFIDRGFLWQRHFRCLYHGDFSNPSAVNCELISFS